MPTPKKTIKAPAKKIGLSTSAQHSYFVLLHYPKEFRRSLLEASKSTIYLLQRYHRMKLLREEKRQEITRLKARMKEIAFLVTKLMEQIPSDVIPPTVERAQTSQARPQAAAKAVKKPEQHHPAPKQLDDMEKLSAHLAHIEERLKNI